MSNVSQFTGLGWVPLETKEITTPSFTVDFSTNIDDTFNNYVVTSTNTLSTTTATIYGKLKTGGVAITIGYRSLATYPGTTTSSTASNASFALITGYQGSFVTYFMNLRSSEPFKSINTQSTGYSSTSLVLRDYNSCLLSTSLIDGIEFSLSSGTFNSGKFTLYGIRELQ
jgi:hypothetical protein